MISDGSGQLALTYIADVIVATSLIAVLVATLLTQFRVRLR